MSVSQVTWQDLQQAPDDGKRREAIEGELYVTPPSGVRHQEVSLALTVALHRFLVEGGHGMLLPGPIGVEFPATGEGVQPDFVFVPRARLGIVDEDWIRGAPDLVAEVLSPTTEARDRGIKRELYERQGIREYWIVDPEGDAVEVWRFGDAGEAPRHERFTDRLPVRIGQEVVGEVDLEEVFRRG